MESKARDLLRVARAHTWAVAAVGGILSAVGIVISEVAFPTSPFRPAVTSLLSATLSAALVSLVADVLLRERFAAAFTALVGLRDEVRTSGLSSIRMAVDVDWNWVLADADAVDALLIDPYPWLASRWGAIAHLARSRVLQLQIHFVRPQSGALSELEYRLGRSLESSCADAERLLKKEWSELQAAGQMDRRSQVGLFGLAHAPAYDLVVARRNNRWTRAGVIIGPSSAALETAAPLAMSFEFGHGIGSDMADWLARQIDSVSQESTRIWAADGKRPSGDVAIPPPDETLEIDRTSPRAPKTDE
jgi:hypothetical protein